MHRQRIPSVIAGTDIDTDYPIRIPQDAFEVSLYRRVIAASVGTWSGPTPANSIAGHLDRSSNHWLAYGYLDGICFAQDYYQSALANGWFPGYLKIKWNAKEEPEIWDLNLPYPTQIPISFALLEREDPASEAYRFKCLWQIVDSELIIEKEQSNFT
jgi:hypothetical protein